MSTATSLPTTAPAVVTHRRPIVLSPAKWFVWAAVAMFFIFLFGIVFYVLVRSFGNPWFDSWFPKALTFQFYRDAWTEFNLGSVIWITLRVAVAVIALSVLIGVPASYVLARRNFIGKQLIYGLFLLPVMMPPITYGIPLATVMYKWGLGYISIWAVILANMVPAVPFVIMTMTPFIEQINPSIESAARMSGAGTGSVFTRILAPLLVPGILASCVLVLVRTVGMFELTYLVGGPRSYTLVVSLFNAMNGAAGIRPPQQNAAMAVVYMVMMLVILIIALRFVNPTQLVARVRDEATN